MIIWSFSQQSCLVLSLQSAEKQLFIGDHHHFTLYRESWVCHRSDAAGRPEPCVGQTHGRPSPLTYHSNTSQSLSCRPRARDDHPPLLVGGTQWGNSVVVSISPNKFPQRFNLGLFFSLFVALSFSLTRGFLRKL